MLRLACIETATIAFGAATSFDGLTMLVPGSDGSSLGIYESFDGGLSDSYVGASVSLVAAHRNE